MRLWPISLTRKFINIFFELNAHQKRSRGFSIICNFCSIFFGCDESICPLYMLTIYIWSTQKWPLRQSMCTHVAHTLNFSKNKKKVEFFFSCGNPVCRLGAHTLSHYTFMRGSDMGLYHCKVSSSYVKWKCKSRGWNLVPVFAQICSCVSFLE